MRRDSQPNPEARGRARAASQGLAGATFGGLLLLLPLFAGGETRVAGEEGVSFNRDIRPLLSDRCFSCHGPDAAGRKADLRLDLEDAAKEFAFLPGRPEDSEALLRMVSADPEDVMPPPESHKTMSPAEIDLVRRWVADGAPWEEHWAFVVPGDGAIPDPGEGWARNPVDRFVAARLEAEGLAPSPEADPVTLIRRVSLDLTGLPPTPQEVREFLADPGDEAYERTVRRLLDSPRYGEHRARYWLDAARYADTHGLHLDNYREMWPYRDWVVEAFNRNLPFDQFTVEQLAGDLLPDAGESQRVATGFNRCNVTTSEGGAIAEEFLVRYAVDRVNTTTAVWLGLTAGCAQCHDHKFDPITQQDYFRLFAYFNHTTQAGMDGNVPDTAPAIRLFADEASRQREEELRHALAEVERERKEIVAAAEPAFVAWLESGAPGRWPGELDLTNPDEAALPVGLGQAFTLALRIEAPEEPGRYLLLTRRDGSGRGLEVTLDTENEGVELALFGAENEGILRVQFIKKIKPGSRNNVVWTYDGTNHPQGATAWVEGREMARNRFPYLEEDRLTGDFASAGPWRVEDHGLTAGSVRFFERILTEEEIMALPLRERVASLLKTPEAERKKEGADSLRTYFLHTQYDAYRSSLAWRSELERERAILLRGAPVTHVMAERTDAAPSAMLLERGEYDRPVGEPLSPGIPEFLPGLLAEAPPNRLGLAQWLVHPDHPLTARVTVNRLWQELFGVGLVATADDFGMQGAPPSHPELLDWLARGFVDGGWDVKRLLETIVLSSTYRQASDFAGEAARRDPENRLLARGPRFRLDAEVLRDQALFTSGLLVEKVGGAPVRPYQPDGIWEPIGYENSNTVSYYRHYGESLYRRSLYTFWKRTAPPPNLTAFDAPNRESCVVRRERTNTPLQALVLMNDVQYVEAARNLAAQVADEPDPVGAMARRVLARDLDAAERGILEQSIQAFRAHYAAHPGAAARLLAEGDSPLPEKVGKPELAALTMVANQFFNLDETITKP